MNLRLKSQSQESYRLFLERRHDHMTKLALVADPTTVATPYPQEMLYILDYLMDAKLAIERILKTSITWSEFDTYYNVMFTAAHRVICRRKDFEELDLPKKDILIHIYLASCLGIESPDEFLAETIRRAKKIETKKSTQEDKEIQELKAKFAESL